MLSVNRGILSGCSHRAWPEQSAPARPLDEGISPWRCGCPETKTERKSTHHAKKDERASPRPSARRDHAAAEGPAGRKSETAHRGRLFKRTQEAASAGKEAEQKARIVRSLRGEFQLKDILAVTGFPKATYMYWQKKFAQPEILDEWEQLILAIRKEHKDYGYRRLWAQLRNLGHKINRKAVQRIVQKLGLQVHSFTHRTRKYSSYKGASARLQTISSAADSKPLSRTRRSQRIRVNSNTGAG